MRVEEKSKEVVRKIPNRGDWLDAIAGTLDEDFLKQYMERPERL